MSAVAAMRATQDRSPDPGYARALSGQTEVWSKRKIGPRFQPPSPKYAPLFYSGLKRSSKPESDCGVEGWPTVRPVQ
jgi:hypothetical protein